MTSLLGLYLRAKSSFIPATENGFQRVKEDGRVTITQGPKYRRYFFNSLLLKYELQ